MKKNKKIDLRKKNSTPKSRSKIVPKQFKPMLSEEDKKRLNQERYEQNISKIQSLRNNDLQGTVTLYFSSERYNIKTNKSYKKIWKQSFPITKEMLEEENNRIIANISCIARDREADYYIIN